MTFGDSLNPLGDRFSHGNREPYVPEVDPSTDEELSISTEAEQIAADAAETREIGKRALDGTVDDVVNGKNPGMARENWDYGEGAEDREALAGEAAEYLAGEDGE